MNPIRSAAFAVFALGPAAAFADLSDADILNKIHSIDQTEISAAAQARKTSSNPKVKKFAARMTRDHGKVDSDVQALAQKKGITLADATPSANPLAATSGADFDRDYASEMVSGHKQALDFLAQADAQTQDPDIKKLVEKLQPAVAHHEKMAEQLQTSLKSSDAL
jgi:putative membrane protein